MEGKFAEPQDVIVTNMAYVTPGYFSALRIPVLLGRPFTESDTPDSGAGCLVNTAFARKLFDEANPIGRHVGNAGHVYRIVGLVGNVTKRLGFSQVGRWGSIRFFMCRRRRPIRTSWSIWRMSGSSRAGL